MLSKVNFLSLEYALLMSLYNLHIMHVFLYFGRSNALNAFPIEMKLDFLSCFRSKCWKAKDQTIWICKQSVLDHVQTLRRSIG